MGHIERKLPGTRFINGDKLTWIDFYIGGWIHNMVLNPRNKYAEQWAAIWANAGPKTKAYAAAFGEEMADYLASRPQDCTF